MNIIRNVVLVFSLVWALPAELRAEPVAKDQSIYVVQHRAYSKKGKLELTLSYFSSLNNKFISHMGPSASAVYHLRENLAVEVLTTIPYLVFPSYSGLVQDVYVFEDLTPTTVDLKLFTYMGAASLQFSALYGKLNFYGSLLDYDFYLAAGFGLVHTIETCEPAGTGDFPPDDTSCTRAAFGEYGDNGKPLAGIGRGHRIPEDSTDRTKLAASLGGGIRFFFSEYAGLRFELRDLSYADRTSDEIIETDIRNHLLLFIGASVLL